jgi:hypothetical protein
MAFFGLRTKDGGADLIVGKIASRLQSDNLIKNPFESWSKEISPGFWVFKITPVYPNVGLFFFFPLLLWVAWPARWFGVAGLVLALGMLLINVWWTGRFYYLLFYLKTKGKVSYISPERAIEGWYRWVSKK